MKSKKKFLKIKLCYIFMTFTYNSMTGKIRIKLKITSEMKKKFWNLCFDDISVWLKDDFLRENVTHVIFTFWRHFGATGIS